MSVAELKERHAAATETVNALRERLKQKRLSLLDTDGMWILEIFCFSFVLWGSNNCCSVFLRSGLF